MTGNTTTQQTATPDPEWTAKADAVGKFFKEHGRMPQNSEPVDKEWAAKADAVGKFVKENGRLPQAGSATETN